MIWFIWLREKTVWKKGNQTISILLELLKLCSMFTQPIKTKFIPRNLTSSQHFEKLRKSQLIKHFIKEDFCFACFWLFATPLYVRMLFSSHTCVWRLFHTTLGKSTCPLSCSVRNTGNRVLSCCRTFFPENWDHRLGTPPPFWTWNHGDVWCFR